MANLKRMDMHSTRERLAKSMARYLEEEAGFLAAVEKAILAGKRGEPVDEREIDARLEAMFNA
jgi:hypothetical protein